MGTWVIEITKLPKFPTYQIREFRNMTDPIADMLTRIRNAVTAKHTRVDMPASRIKADIARILQDEGYIQGFKLLDDATAVTKTLRLFLKYGPHGAKLIT